MGKADKPFWHMDVAANARAGARANSGAGPKGEPQDVASQPAAGCPVFHNTKEGSSMDHPPPQRPGALFADIPERNTADVILRTAQQHHVSLSVMADTKANIIITVSSIVLTLSMGKLDQNDLKVSVITLTVFTLLALLLAILAVLPKYRPLRLTTVELPSNFNLLFFGHFAELSRDRYLTEIATTLKPDGSIYAAMANDIYSLGSYLAHHKYRYLRWSYLSFLTGFILASVEQVWRMFVH
jgi:hypothetical protein